MTSESKRLFDAECHDTPEGPSIVVRAQCVDAAQSLQRVKEVLMHIAGTAADESWPSDAEWTRRLPSWFTEPFRGRPIEQVLKDDTLWDYGSWLDAMRNRGWRWWCSSCEDDWWTATLIREDQVYSIEPLIYLARQSGASTVEVIEQ